MTKDTSATAAPSAAANAAHSVIRLFDQNAGQLRDLVPVVDGQIRMYVCGPTVQSSPHVGHLRSALSYDLLRRWLTFKGFRVVFVRNVTDIDDKILANASDQDPWWALAYRVEREFTSAYQALNMLPPTVEPRATGHIGAMVKLIQHLIDRGHAYVSPDGTGDVYFDTASWPDYGQLTNQFGDDLETGEAATAAKRDPRDFALWKGKKESEPSTAAWDAPWGSGRPGWHIECSAMAVEYLGEQFDIHGGGQDLRFPHHENELAQSQAAGHPFANHWVHNGLVTVNGQKMSKSLGNSVFAAELIAETSGRTLRYLLGSAHYRSNLDITDTAFVEASAALDRIDGFVTRASKLVQAQLDPGATPTAHPIGTPLTVPDDFVAAMDADLAVPTALAVLHECVSDGNRALETGDTKLASQKLLQVRGMLEVLGLTDDAQVDAKPALDAAMGLLIERRAAARAVGDFATADTIRDTLAASGVRLEDSASGTDWSLS